MEPKSKTSNEQRVASLIEKGAQLPCPSSVEIGPDINLHQIEAEGLYLGPGSRLMGETTFVGRGARIGTHGPAVVSHCQLATDVELGSGTFEQATFLCGSKMGPNAQVREGTLLEESASGAHCVGLKQTILFPFVTLGSLINFCDCLMSGGTGPKNHSEVGSSYIHFNFTTHQDKATASILGDVAHGVMLNQDPIFLGGQGGLVGPRRLAFGTIAAAGTIVRKDELRLNRLLIGSEGRRASIPYQTGQFHGINRIVQNNLIYIANLMTLMQWYRRVRMLFISDQSPKAVIEGAQQKLSLALAERIRRLGQLSEKIHQAYRNVEPEAKALVLHQRWSTFTEKIEHACQLDGSTDLRDRFLEEIQTAIAAHGTDYLQVMMQLPQNSKTIGSQWLSESTQTRLDLFWTLWPEIKPR